MNSDLKIYTCEASKHIESSIGVLEIKNQEIKLSPQFSNHIDGQRFVANGTQILMNNYNKISEDELNTLPYFQNYQKGIPSKVSVVYSNNYY